MSAYYTYTRDTRREASTNAREQRGLEIAAHATIEKRGDAWIVPSQSLKWRYTVTVGEDGYRCSCPVLQQHFNVIGRIGLRG
jgi:hypothetical protein